MSILAAVVVAFAIGQQKVGEVPDILANAFQHREAFHTGRFCYESESVFPGVKARSKERYDVRTCGNDIAWTNFGDDDGIVLRDPATGTPTFGVIRTFSYQQTIRNRDTGVQWSRVEGGNGILRSRSMSVAPVVSDPRSIGLRPLDPRDRSPSQLLTQLAETPAKWRVSSDGDVRVVTMECEPTSDGDPRHSEMVWRIDPAKDNAIVESSVSLVAPDGKRELLGSCKVEYERHDDRYWPSFARARAPLTGIEQEFRFRRAEFDRPDHPQRLTPDIWNLPRGVMVKSRFDPEAGQDSYETMRYLGDGIVISSSDWESIRTEADFAALIAFWDHNKAKGWGEFPEWWGREGAGFGLKDLETDPDAWEAYVRRWIYRHSELPYLSDAVSIKGLTPEQIAAVKLKPEQVNAAWAILKDCRRRAQPILRKTAGRSGSEAVEAPVGSAATNQTASAGRVSADVAASGPKQTLASRTDQGYSEPTWETVSSAQLKQPAERVAAKPGVSAQQQHELARIFAALKKRLGGLLEFEQRLPEDRPANASPQ